MPTHDQHGQDGAGHPAGGGGGDAPVMPGSAAPGHERAHRLGRRLRAPLALLALARPGRRTVTIGDGAEAGSVARRRVPGTSASSPPSPMSRPPAHSQATSGSITTPMATEPAGRLGMGWLPDVAPEAADGVEGQVDVAEEPRVDGGRSHDRRARRRSWSWPG